MRFKEDFLKPELVPTDLYSGTTIYRYAEGAVKLYHYIVVSLSGFWPIHFTVTFAGT